jgi:hypothetical protein
VTFAPGDPFRDGEKQNPAPGDLLPVTPRQFQGDFNLSENVFIVRSNCIEDFRQDEEGGYMREMNYPM